MIDGEAYPNVVINLYRNDDATTPYRTATLTNGATSYLFDELPTHDASGNEYTYTVEEVVPNGYTMTRDGNAFTNTANETEVSGTKAWEMIEGETKPAVTIVLYRNGEQYDTVALAEDDTYSFTGLPTHDANGNAYVYEVQELTVPGYTSTSEPNETNGKNFTNTADTTNVSGEKLWDDGNSITRPEDIILALFAHTDTYTKEITWAVPVWVKNGNVWNYTFDGLPTHDELGNAYTYTVTEAPIAGYRTIQLDTNITNTLNNPVVELTKSVDKTQVLGGDQFAYTVTLTNRMLRPATVTGVYDNLAAGQTFGSFTSHGSGSASYNDTTRVITWSGIVPAASYVEGEFVPGTTAFTFTVTADELVALEEGYRLLVNSATGEFLDPYAQEFPDPDQELPIYLLTSNEVEVEVFGPVMSIIKEANKTDAHPGETLTYTLRVQSLSLLPFDVTISDLLPDGVTFEEFVTTGFGETQDAANLKLLSWNFTMPAATFDPDTMDVIAPSEVTLSFVVNVDAITVDQDVVTIVNSAVLTPQKEDETPYDPIPSNEVETDVTAEVSVHKAASVIDMYVGDPTQDRRWVYVFTLTNTNTAPMQVNLVDEFDPNISFYNWVSSISTDPSVYPHIVSEAAYEDPDTGIQSINVTLVLAPATVDAQGNVIPSEVQYAVIVEGDYIELEGDASVEIAVPNIGRYSVSTNIVDPINPQTARKDTNTATVIVWAINGVLPVTGEWIMVMVPFGGLMALAGVLLLLMNRRKQHAK